MTPMNRLPDKARIIIIFVLPSVLVLIVAYLASRVNEFSWVVAAVGLIIALLQLIIGLEQLRLAASHQTARGQTIPKTARGQTIKNFFARRFRLIILVVLVLLELATLLVAYNPLRIFSGPAQKWAYQTGGAIHSSPAVVNGVVYVGSDDGNLYALDAASGTRKWAYQTGGAIASSPAVVNGVVYIGSEDHSLYALDAASGTKKWAYQTGGAIHSSPQVVNGVLYVGSDDGKLYAFGLLS